MNKKEFYFLRLTQKDRFTGDTRHAILYSDNLPAVFFEEDEADDFLKFEEKEHEHDPSMHYDRYEYEYTVAKEETIYKDGWSYIYLADYFFKISDDYEYVEIADNLHRPIAALLFPSISEESVKDFIKKALYKDKYCDKFMDQNQVFNYLLGYTLGYLAIKRERESD